jgi:hypothetical protein
MPTEPTVADRPPQSRRTPVRSTDERGRLLPGIFPTTDEERRASVASWDETVRELESMIDETDTPELWDEVLRNLGVDPETGRGLPTRRGVRIGRRTGSPGGSTEPLAEGVTP